MDKIKRERRDRNAPKGSPELRKSPALSPLQSLVEEQFSVLSPCLYEYTAKPLSQPPSTNSTGNVVAFVQIPTVLPQNSKCHPHHHPRSASRSRHPLPVTQNTFTKRYTTRRRARQRPSPTTLRTNPLILPPIPRTPTPSRPTVPSKRQSKETRLLSTRNLPTVQLPSATIPVNCDPETY